MSENNPKPGIPKILLANGEIANDVEDSPPRIPFKAEHLVTWASLLLTTIVIAILYAAGYAFREGYLGALSLGVEQMPIEFHAMLYWGYVTNVGRWAVYFWAISVPVVFLGAIITLGRAGNEILQKRFPRFRWLAPKVRTSQRAGGRSTSSHIPLGLSMLLVGIVMMFGVCLPITGFLLAKDATDNGRGAAEIMMAAFLEDELTAAKTYKLRCTRMIWEKDGKSREKYGYPLRCNDKLCKIFEPKTKAFPTVFLTDIQSITPLPAPIDKAKSCVVDKTI